MKTNINKGQMDTNTQLLAEYITTEPEYIQDIINKAAKEAIEEYAESYCSEDVIINRYVDVDCLVRAEIVLPALIKSSSYKDFGFRIFEFEIYFATHYGKAFLCFVKVVCTEHINDAFCTTLKDGTTVIACNWIEPYQVFIKQVVSYKDEGWEVEKEFPQIVEL